MAILKNWESRNKYFEIRSGTRHELENSPSFQGFGFKKAEDFFGVYKDEERLILNVNGHEIDVDKVPCVVKYSNNPLFERVKILSGRKTVFGKIYWILGNLKRVNIEQPMDSIDEEQQYFFPWLKKVVEKKISFQTK
jgi:hypothetical protein